MTQKQKLSLPPNCPICGVSAEKFEAENNKPKRRCPGCGSLERHRVFMDLYASGTFGERLLEKKRVLRVSPSAAEKTILRQIPWLEDITVDIRPHKHTRLVADISNMPHIPTGSFDLAYVCGVFFAVNQLPEAVAELFRVLKPGGILLCTDFLTPNEETVNIADFSKITAYYGQEEYDKWGVGSFRRFGELDYAKHFRPYFSGGIHYGVDSATGMRIGWFCGRMNAACITETHQAASSIRSLTRPFWFAKMAILKAYDSISFT